MEDADVAPAHWHEAYMAYAEYGEWAAILHPTSPHSIYRHEYFQICIVRADKARENPVGDHSGWGPPGWRVAAYTVQDEDKARAWFEVVADCLRQEKLPKLDPVEVVNSWPPEQGGIFGPKEKDKI